LLWGLLKWKLPMHASKIIFYYALSECLHTVLAFNDKIPSYLQFKDLHHAENKIMASMVISFCFSYNSILQTTLILPPMFLVSYYLQLTKQVELWEHPYLGRPL